MRIRQRLLILLGVFLFPLAGFCQSLQLADSLRLKGERLHEGGNFKEAEFNYRKAYHIYRHLHDTASWLKTGVYFGEVLSYRGKKEKAIEIFNYLKSIPHSSNDKALKARIESDLGWTFIQSGEESKALEHLNEAHSFAKEANDTLLIGITLNNLANTHKNLGAYEKALALQKEALPFFEKLKNARSLAYTLSDIGTIYRNLTLYDKALDYYTQSLQITLSLGNVHMLAIIYDKLGGLQKELGNYDQALIALQKSLEYRKKANSPRGTASTLNQIGTLYNSLGSPDKALQYYRESLQIWKTTSNPISVAATYKNIGNRLWEAGKQEKAIIYYRKALQLKKRAGKAGAIVTSLLDLAKVENDYGNTAKALVYSHDALALADSLNDYNLLKEVHRSIAAVHRKNGNNALVLKHATKALAHSRFLNKNEQLTPLMDLAYYYGRVGSDSALYYGSRAIDIIEERRKRAGSLSDIKASFMEQYSGFYLSMASWTLELTNDVAGAFRLVESAKARALADELVQASQRVDEPLPEQARIERNKKLKTIDTLYTKLQEAQTDSLEQLIEEKIREAELSYAAFENELTRKHPGYKSLELENPITAKRAQSIHEPGTATLEYAVADDRIILFFITSDELLAKTIALPGGEASRGRPSYPLTEQVQQFKDAILAHAPREELSFYASGLYNLLLKPFEDRLSSYTKLTIVPDGPLAYLPFEALMHDNRYLIEDYDIKYVPSLTTMTLIKTPEKQVDKELLAVAGSDFPANSGSASVRRKSYTSLPSTLIEVDSVASHFTETVILKNDRVSETALKKLFDARYRFIHLATHGFIDEEFPAQSGLALSSSRDLEASSAEDGLLKSFEIYRLKLGSEMVVLSACNTGLGKVVGGEGILGLQRAFFYAGASSVVVSLWNVFDRSTAHLMNEFYKSIIRNETNGFMSLVNDFSRWTGWDDSIPYGNKARAMREAKRKLINHPVYNHPVYWAPFVVVGR